MSKHRADAIDQTDSDAGHALLVLGIFVFLFIYFFAGVFVGKHNQRIDDQDRIERLCGTQIHEYGGAWLCWPELRD